MIFIRSLLFANYNREQVNGNSPLEYGHCLLLNRAKPKENQRNSYNRPNSFSLISLISFIRINSYRWVSEYKIWRIEMQQTITWFEINASNKIFLKLGVIRRTSSWNANKYKNNRLKPFILIRKLIKYEGIKKRTQAPTNLNWRQNIPVVNSFVCRISIAVI